MTRLTLAQRNKEIGMLICGLFKSTSCRVFPSSNVHNYSIMIQMLWKDKLGLKIRITWNRWHDQLYRLGKNTWHSDPEFRWIDAPEDSTMRSSEWWSYSILIDTKKLYWLYLTFCEMIFLVAFLLQASLFWFKQQCEMILLEDFVTFCLEKAWKTFAA